MTYPFEKFYRTWEIIECKFNENCTDTECLEGVRFQLDAKCNVKWTKLPENGESPLFLCDTFMVCCECPGFTLNFGGYDGHLIKFRAQEPNKKLILTCDQWCLLYCREVNSRDEFTVDNRFSLLPALECGFFSDLTVTSTTGVNFNVHKCIVNLLGADVAWTETPPFCASEAVLKVIFTWLYGEHLPRDIDEAVVNDVIRVCEPYACFSRLIDMSRTYLRNVALRNEIINLIKDLHLFIDNITENFEGRRRRETIISNPEQLCHVMRQTLRDILTGAMKFILIWNLFNHHKHQLSQDDSNQIVQCAKKRLPIFMAQLRKLARNIKCTLDNVSMINRQELATYLAPEIATTLDMLYVFIVALKNTVLKIIQALKKQHAMMASTPWRKRTLRHILFIKTFTTLQNLLDRISHVLAMILAKKEKYAEMTASQKERSILRNMDVILMEIPVFFFRLEEFLTSLEKEITSQPLNFCFKVAANKLEAIIRILHENRETIEGLMKILCQLIQRDAFTKIVHELGLLDTELSNNAETNASDTYDRTPIKHEASETDQLDGTFKIHLNDEDFSLSLVESLHQPPIWHESHLAIKSLEQFHAHSLTDMTFVIDLDEGDDGSDKASDVPVPMEKQANNEGTSNAERTIEVHRAIVAARCDYFRRALLSGMIESISRSIRVHDTDEVVFRIFLQYLYSGRILDGERKLTHEQLAELMLLSDRYEFDELKATCEAMLKRFVNGDNVFYFYHMADQFSAGILKDNCIEYMKQNNDLIDSDSFLELPLDLQSEIYGLVLPNSGTAGFSDKVKHQELDLFEELENACRANADHDAKIAATSLTRNANSFEHIGIDDALLEQCMNQLEEIIGAKATRDELRQIAIAADLDLNRALNYYFPT